MLSTMVYTIESVPKILSDSGTAPEYILSCLWSGCVPITFLTFLSQQKHDYSCYSVSCSRWLVMHNGNTFQTMDIPEFKAQLDNTSSWLLSFWRYSWITVHAQKGCVLLTSLKVIPTLPMFLSLLAAGGLSCILVIHSKPGIQCSVRQYLIWFLAQLLNNCSDVCTDNIFQGLSQKVNMEQN